MSNGRFEVGHKRGMQGRRHSERSRLKMSAALTGRKQTEEEKIKRVLSRGFFRHSAAAKQKMSDGHKGSRFSEEHIKHLRESHGNYDGEARRPIKKRIRFSRQGQEWRQKVFIRDDFTCQQCGARGVFLHAHHKKPFIKILEEIKANLPLFDLYEGAMIYTPLWDLENGISLCKKYHYERHRKES